MKLAYMINATGPAPKGQNVDVAKAWVAYTNAHGGVAGHPVDLEIKDTKADAPTGQTFANELAKDPSVLGVMVLDPVGESTFIPTLVDQGLPVLGGVGSSQKVWGVLPNVFAVATTPKTVANGFVLAAQDAGAKGIGVAACAEAEACSAGVPLFQAEANKLGIKFTGVVKLDLNATSYTAECLQLMQNGTDFMLLAATAVAGIRLFNDCAQQGYKGNLGASVGAVTPDLYDGSPDIRLTGMIGAFPWWVDDAPVKQFRDVMQAGGVDAKKYGSPNGTATYTSLELFKKALESDSALPAEPTRADVLAAYGKLKDETLGGLLPKPLTFTPGQPGPDVNCFWFYKYADGQFSGSFKPACDPDS
ncbi:MAG TPA: ABC transporter substrate-binding protein [Nocardioidaceae bacterium]